MLRRYLPPLVLALLVSTAAAVAGTSFRMSIVPLPPRCGRAQCLNGAGACTVDADCNVGTLKPTSAFQFTGKHLVMKASITGATDASGNPLQTDGIPGTADDYILELDANRRESVDELCPLSGCPEALAVAKVDFKKGKAKVTLDLSLLPAAPDGNAFRLRGGSLRLPPANPADCPGDNTAAGLMMRARSDCVGGAVLGMGGFVVGE